MSRILVVDDDEVARLVVGRALESDGHRVSFAPDGDAALRFLGLRTFDVVVTDLAMPGLNGLRLIRHIRESGDQIPILAISGQNADQLHLAEEYGANATLVKPVDRNVLCEAVKAITEAADSVWDDVWL